MLGKEKWVEGRERDRIEDRGLGCCWSSSSIRVQHPTPPSAWCLSCSPTRLFSLPCVCRVSSVRQNCFPCSVTLGLTLTVSEDKNNAYVQDPVHGTWGGAWGTSGQVWLMVCASLHALPMLTLCLDPPLSSLPPSAMALISRFEFCKHPLTICPSTITSVCCIHGEC